MIDDESSVDQDFEATRYLYELTLLEQDEVDDYKARKFDSDALAEVAIKLSGIFLSNVDFETKLKSYFEESAWIQVKELIAAKVKHSTCGVCTLLCKDRSKTCLSCHMSYHFVCENVLTYRKTESSKWKCKSCIEK